MNNRQKLSSLLVFGLILNMAACAGSYDSDDDSQSNVQGSAKQPGRPAVQVFQIGGDADHPVLRNKDRSQGRERNTGISVMNGDRIEIKPSCLLRERRRVIDPLVVREDHSVCTQ